MVDDPCLKSQTLTVRMSLRAGGILLYSSLHGWDNRPPTEGSSSLHPRNSECVALGMHHIISTSAHYLRCLTMCHDTCHDPHVDQTQASESRTQEAGREREAKRRKDGKKKPRHWEEKERTPGVRESRAQFANEGGAHGETWAATSLPAWKQHKVWWLQLYLNIGEAANPGPEHRRGMKVWSANVTSLGKRWQCMATWDVDAPFSEIRCP